jgi:hypothetical protein
MVMMVHRVQMMLQHQCQVAAELGLAAEKCLSASYDAFPSHQLESKMAAVCNALLASHHLAG